MSRSSAQHPGPPWPPDPRALRSLLEQETALFERAHPVSKELYARGCEHFLYGAPMHWMQQWAGSYPIYVSEARGARVTDVDGNEYVDFALGDTGAMFGHANPAVTAAISDQLSRGSTMMLPTEDSLWVGEELARRFGLPYWQVTTSATDANRFVIRLCRMISGRSKVVTFNWNYHGSVDETQVELDEHGRTVPRTGVHPAPDAAGLRAGAWIQGEAGWHIGTAPNLFISLNL